ncbi:MAG: hypothetical protein Q8P22_00120 [Chloroflexota bacterium]|nr:hypothetical protein [Chloroflexota bacterium]
MGRRRSIMAKGLVGAVILLLAGCQQPAVTPPAGWSIPADKYVFIERWIEIYEGSSMFIDFPTYRFDRASGELWPDIVPPGPWFPLEDLTELKVVNGRGTSRSGSAGAGANSRVFAVARLPFAEPPRDDTTLQLTVEGVDARGVAYLSRGGQQIVLRPGEGWTWDGKSTVEWGGTTFELSARERITNFGVLEKSKIRLTK